MPLILILLYCRQSGFDKARYDTDMRNAEVCDVVREILQ